MSGVIELKLTGPRFTSEAPFLGTMSRRTAVFCSHQTSAVAPLATSTPASKSNSHVPCSTVVPDETTVPVRNRFSRESFPLYSTNSSWFWARRRSQPMAPPSPVTSIVNDIPPPWLRCRHRSTRKSRRINNHYTPQQSNRGELFSGFLEADIAHPATTDCRMRFATPVPGLRPRVCARNGCACGSTSSVVTENPIPAGLAGGMSYGSARCSTS